MAEARAISRRQREVLQLAFLQPQVEDLARLWQRPELTTLVRKKLPKA